ncbi:hypothetical protein [Bradyrhizobium sp. SRS-191]|nr:hypothetical protein [Bradyrhizobium sp. SRS-191]
MASWLELLFNIIGYGGFVLIASRHHGAETSVTGLDVRGIETGPAGPDRL